MSDNKRGVALGCTVLLLVAAFFIGVPTLIYYTYFGPVGEEESIYWLKQAEAAALADEYGEVIALSDSALVREASAMAYYYKLMGAYYENDLKAAQEAVAGLVALPWPNKSKLGIEDYLSHLGDGPAYDALRRDVLGWHAQKGEFGEVEDEFENVILHAGGDASFDWLLECVRSREVSLQGVNAIAEYYIENKEYYRGVELYTALNEKFPDNNVILNNLGTCHYHAGNMAEAMRYLEQSADLGNTQARANLEKLEKRSQR